MYVGELLVGVRAARAILVPAAQAVGVRAARASRVPAARVAEVRAARATQCVRSAGS